MILINFGYSVTLIIL